MNEVIPVAAPWITQREIQLASEAAATAWGVDNYKFNARFEKAFADYIGVKYAVSLPHCTSAIHLSLAALGIGKGDEVIVPDVTWIASVAPVIYVGAEPVFADINPDTWCIDPVSVEACITPKTKAIIGVNLYGSMADWTRLKEIASRHGLALIEDAAEALGSRLNNIPAGAFGDTGVFSFHGSKTVTTGEGGMLVTDDEAIHQRVLTLRDHGRPVGDRLFLNDEIGFKYKMSAMQAAMGLAQIERIDELIAHKRQIFKWYRDRLQHRNDLRLNIEPENVFNSYWMVTAILPPELGIDKFKLMAALKDQGIDTRPFFSPLSKLPAFSDRQDAARFLPSTPKGHRVSDRGINLPSGYNLNEEMVDRIVTSFLAAILT